MHSRFQTRHIGCLLATALLLSALTVVGGCGDREVRTNQSNDSNQNQTNQNQTNQNQTNQNQDSNSEDAPPFEEYSSALDTSRCELIMDCCSAEQRESEFGMDVSDVDGCVSYEEGIFGGLGLGGFQLEQSLEAGRIEFDEGMAELCQESIQGLSCSDFDGSQHQTDNLPGCKDMIVGLVEPGGTCTTNYECTTEFCLHESGESEGECQSVPELGADCPNDRCGPDAYCDRFDNVCKELRMSGEPCMDDEECRSGYCASGDGDQLTCQQRGAVCGG